MLFDDDDDDDAINADDDDDDEALRYFRLITVAGPFPFDKALSSPPPLLLVCPPR